MFTYFVDTFSSSFRYGRGEKKKKKNRRKCSDNDEDTNIAACKKFSRRLSVADLKASFATSAKRDSVSDGRKGKRYRNGTIERKTVVCGWRKFYSKNYHGIFRNQTHWEKKLVDLIKFLSDWRANKFFRWSTNWLNFFVASIQKSVQLFSFINVVHIVILQ